MSTFNLGCELDLKHIAMNARNSEYNPKRFAACIMRIRDPKTTALIFKSGKVVCTGAKSEEISLTSAKMYAKQVRKLGFAVKFSDFKVQNMVASTELSISISLEGLANEHYKFCRYDPELFPGLIYRLAKPKLVMLIFNSGKIVFTGAKTREQLNEAFERIEPVLRRFKRQPPAAQLAKIQQTRRTTRSGASFGTSESSFSPS